MLLFKLFIYLFRLGLRCCLGFSLVAVSGAYSVVSVSRLLIAVASSVEEHDLGHASFSSWGTRAPERRLNSCGAQT